MALTPPPSRGRRGGGISHQTKQKLHNISIRKRQIPHPNPPLKGEGKLSQRPALKGRETSLILLIDNEMALTPPPSRGRLGGGISHQAKQKLHNLSIRKRQIPHPNPPLKGEGN
ncbi:hypothetical protein FORC55_2515 [Vibrio cholerae]|nr:hypothetical protein FORC55_2515 [Vibrio cholerae]